MNLDDDLESEDDSMETIPMTIQFKISGDYRLVENNAEAAFLVCYGEDREPGDRWIEVNTATGYWETITYH